MIQKIKSYGLSIIALLTLVAPLTVPAFVSAQGCNSSIADQVANGANAASGQSSVTCGATGVNGQDTIANIASTIVNIFSIVVGAAAVIMIILAGFRYITSGGSSDKVGGAKNSLIYAIIGLVVVALAQLIVHYVLNKANTLGT